MTTEELVVSIRVTAEDVEEQIRAIRDSLKNTGATVDDIRKKGDPFGPMSETAKKAEEQIQATEDSLKNTGATVDDIRKKGDPFKPMSDGAGQAAAANAALAAAATAAFAKITAAIQSGTQAFNAYTAAVQGLDSIASGRGIGQEAMNEALSQVRDGFFSATAAATAFKNLLLRGYSLDQATVTITRLKDAAAFGRQASMSLEDAVVSATEGIKNENSVLVDNAGVTKNVAQMWEDYADSIGVSAASLTQAQKVEAEYQGILKETELQAGDLAKATDTLAGTQAKQQEQTTKLATAYGEAMAPAIQYATESGTSLLETATGIVQMFPEVISGATSAAAAFTALAAAMKGVKAIEGLMSAMSIGSASLIPMAALAAAVGLVTAAYTACQQAQEEAANAQEEAAQAAEQERKAREEQIDALESEKDQLTRLAEEYRELTSQQDLSAIRQARLERLIDQLVSDYGLSREALEGLSGAYDSGNTAIEDRIRLYEEERRAIIQTQIENDKAALAQAEASKAAKREAIGLRTDAALGASGLFEVVETFDAENPYAQWERQMNAWLDQVRVQAPQAYEEMYAASRDWLNAIDGDTSQAVALYDAFLDGLQAEADAIDAETDEIQSRIAENEERLKGITSNIPERQFSGTGDGTDVGAAQDALAAYKDALDAAVALNESQRDLATLQSDTATAAEKQAAALALQMDGYGYLLGDAEAIAAAQALMIEQAGTLSQTYEEQRGLLEEQLAALEAAYTEGDIGYEDYCTQAAELNAALAQTLSGAIAAAEAMESLTDSAQETDDALTSLRKEAESTGKRLQTALDFKTQISSMKDLARQVKASGGSWDDLSENVKRFAQNMGVAEGDIDGAILALEEMEAQTDASVQSMISDIQGMISSLETMRAEIIAASGGTIDVDTSPALAAITALINLLYSYLNTAAEAGITPVSTGSSGSRGGGGGGSSSAASDAAASAQRAAEEAYQAEIERIEHRRHMGEITAQEEIAELERVKREYAQTAEQIMDIDERIYDARQALRESEQDKITALHDALMDALEARYEAQREIEQQRISESIAAWEKWSDETCAAIQKQIDALDEQAEAEDREKTRAENLRKIDSLEQALEYETDEYNQSQLKRQIEQAKAAWEEIQADWAREDQKAALQAQMQAVQDQANAEIDRLEAESERIDSVYDALTDSQALYAEAQKQMMQSSQEELLGLLAEYAPDYEAAGRTLGEKLYEGFAAAFGDITAYFSDLDAQFEQMAQNTQQTALGRSEAIKAQGEAQAAVSAPVISQTVNFNEPVESPADITRRMQQVSEQLAGMI